MSNNPNTFEARLNALLMMESRQRSLRIVEHWRLAEEVIKAARVVAADVEPLEVWESKIMEKLIEALEALDAAEV